MTALALRDFDGDLQALARLAYLSWPLTFGDATYPDLHHPALLAHTLAEAAPGSLIGAYTGAELVGFLALLPRRYHLGEAEWNGVYMCLQAAHPDHAGVAAYLLAEAYRRMRPADADLALGIAHRLSTVPVYFARLTQMLPMRRLGVMQLCVRAIDFGQLMQAEALPGWQQIGLRLLRAPRLPTASPLHVRPYRPADLPAIAQHFQRRRSPRQLVRAYTPDALAARLHTPGISGTLVYEEAGSVGGFLNYTLLDMLNPRGRWPWVWVDFLGWEGLGLRPRLALLDGLTLQAQQDGRIAIAVWPQRPGDALPLLLRRHAPLPRPEDIFALPLNPTLSLHPVNSVFEHLI